MKIYFYGATQTVTGSKYLVEHANKKYLVDCGLFQGLKTLRLRNWAEFPVDPAKIDAVILTHAHIDHSGYIPRLVKKGFRGKIYCTPATRALCEILLPDAGYLQVEEAAYANKKGFSKHSPALPLFDVADAKKSLEYFFHVPYHSEINLGDGLSFTFNNAGHILGSASVILSDGQKKEQSRIAFSGDLGRSNDLIMPDPEPLPSNLDYLVVESTYGDRQHEASDSLTDLEQIINRTYSRGGVIMIPAFAVGRTQTLLHLLAELKKQKRIPDMPMYLNSPMAIDVTGLYCDYEKNQRLSKAQIQEMCQVVKYVNSEDESRALSSKKGPMLIIAGSGMMTGGRILHHIKTWGSFKENTIIFAGYQAAGTRGATIMSGGRMIKIHGQYTPIRAEICSMDNLSAHADYSETLNWLKQSKIQPKKVFLTHGEPASADALRRRLEEEFHWDCQIPEYKEMIEV